MSTPEEQQVLQQHYQKQISTLLQELRMAIEHLPKMRAARAAPLPAAALLLQQAEQRVQDLSRWTVLRAILQLVWNKPGGVAAHDISSDKEGAMRIASRLLDNMGAEQGSRLDDSDRLECIQWISSLRDAVNSRAHELSQSAPAQSSSKTKMKLLNAQTSNGRAAPTPRAQQTATPRTSIDSAGSAVSRPDSRSTIQSALDPGAMENGRVGHVAGPSPGWAAPPPPPEQRAAALLAASSMPRSASTHRKLASSAPSRKSITGPPDTIPTRPSPFALNPTPPPKKRKIATSVPRAPRRSVEPQLQPQPPVRPVSDSDRPQRARKLPKKLEDGEETVLSLRADELSSSDDEEFINSRLGQAVMAKFPNYSWWPAIILDPRTAPRWTQGQRTQGSLLVKSIPTGGDHRWVVAQDIRELTSHEVNEVIIPEKYEVAPPLSWKRYRADLIEGCLIALDQSKLDEWSRMQTEADFVSEKKTERRKSGGL